ncbi:hypothetical protein AB0J52_02165 [Spirillospora sp. NPDC049652]
MSRPHCDGVAYVIAQPRTGDGRGQRVLGRLNLVKGTVKTIAPAPDLDALGYNPRDGLLYGVRNRAADGGPPSLQTIVPRDGSVKDSVPLPQDTYTAGAFSRDGLFYVRGRSTVLVVNVRSKARVVRSFEVDSAVRLGDFAARPSDGVLFGVDNAHGDLVRISPRSGTVKRLGRLGVRKVSAAFFDADGTFRVAGDRLAGVDVTDLRASRRQVDVRRVAVHPVRPPALIDGAGCLPAVPRLVEAPSPRIAPRPV